MESKCDFFLIIPTTLRLLITKVANRFMLELASLFYQSFDLSIEILIPTEVSLYYDFLHLGCSNLKLNRRLIMIVIIVSTDCTSQI